jgi:hypothetical protein
VSPEQLAGEGANPLHAECRNLLVEASRGIGEHVQTIFGAPPFPDLTPNTHTVSALASVDVHLRCQQWQGGWHRVVRPSAAVGSFCFGRDGGVANGGLEMVGWCAVAWKRLTMVACGGLGTAHGGGVRCLTAHRPDSIYGVLHTALETSSLVQLCVAQLILRPLSLS